MKQDDLLFYTNPQSRGRIVRWMLEETGVPYKTEVVQYGAPMKSEKYLAINPMGKVPAISLKGKVVTEVAAICAFLADAFPEAKLAPPLAERHDYYRWLFFTAGPFEAAVTNRSFGWEPPSDKQGVVGYGTFEATVETLAKAVSKNLYVCGEAFTAADVYVGMQISWGMKFSTLPKRAEFSEYWERVSEREAYRRATDLDNQLL